MLNNAIGPPGAGQGRRPGRGLDADGVEAPGPDGLLDSIDDVRSGASTEYGRG
jgi:hypothetical protein